MQSRWRRCVAVVVVALACAALAAPAAGAANRFPYPDRSLNGTGTVDLTPLLSSPALSGRRLSYAATPSGAVWVEANKSLGCTPTVCSSSHYLSRLNSNGELVTSLGESGSLGYADGYWNGAIVSDATGRAITVTPESTEAITVRRFLPSGALDPTFGSGGATTFECACVAEYAGPLGVGFDNEGRIVITIQNFSSLSSPGFDSIVRLLPNGSFDPSFGTGGIVRTTATNSTQFVSPGGAVFLASGEGDFGETAGLHRYTKKGVADTAFDAKANAVLAKAQQAVGESVPATYQVVAMRFRKDGVVDVILSSTSGSTVVRLRSTGSPEADFADDGVRQLGRIVSEAIPAGDGDTIALTESPKHQRGEELSQLLPNYKFDPGFATKGALATPIVDQEGRDVLISLASKGRVTVVDEGLRFCREGNCGAEPSLLRYRVGPVK
jgi:hypothetical protein